MKQHLQKSLDRLHNRFTYEQDDGEVWEILSSEGSVKGDCEDFAMTLLVQIEGKFWKPILKGQYAIYFCRFKGYGHVVLCHKKTGLFADNIRKTWNSYEYLKDHHYTDFDRYGSIKIALKLLAGWFKKD